MDLLALQLDLVWHDPEANRKKVENWLDRYSGPYDLILLPEMFTTGFSMEAEQLAEPDMGPTYKWMQELAWTRGAAIGGSLITEENGTYTNRFYFISPEGDVHYYDKRHTFRMAGEHEQYESGQSRVVVEYKNWRILLLICYDLRFPVWARNRVDGDTLEYDLIALVANWPQPRIDQWETLIKARAIENQCYVAAVNRVGEDGNGHPYSGSSMIVNPLGKPIVYAHSQEGLLHAALSKKDLAFWRNKFPFWMDSDAFSLD